MPRSTVVATLVVGYAAAGCLIAAVLVAGAVLDQPVDVFIRDPWEWFPVVPWYAAFLVHVGALAWWTAASACLLTAVVLRLRGDRSGSGPFFGAGLLSALLSLDDILVIHDGLLAQAFGVPEPVTFVVYGLLVLAYLIAFRGFLRGTTWSVLALALVLFAGSILLDLLDVLQMVEESFKLFGIVTWSVYFVLLCGSALRAPGPD